MFILFFKTDVTVVGNLLLPNLCEVVGTLSFQVLCKNH